MALVTQKVRLVTAIDIGAGAVVELGVLQNTMFAKMIILKFWGGDNAAASQGLNARAAWTPAGGSTQSIPLVITSPATGLVMNGLEDTTALMVLVVPVSGATGEPEWIRSPNVRFQLQGNAGTPVNNVNVDAWILYDQDQLSVPPVLP